MLTIFALAMIFGLSRLYFKSTIPGIFGHLLNNLFASIAIFSGAYG